MAKQVQFSSEDFKKTSLCHTASCCVEVAYKDGMIAVRDNKNLQQTPLHFTTEEWTAFVEGVKNGEFDFPK